MPGSATGDALTSRDPSGAGFGHGRTLRAWRAPCRSSPTRTGTGSGTRRSRRSGCSWSTCSTTSSPGSRPTRRSRTSCSTARWRWSTTTSRSAPRPKPRLRRLATSGRLAMGPWYALPDEFLVSGETLVRNLQLGLRRAAAFGGAMDVGYLPDMFGHVAQMPQVLRPVRLRARRRVAGRAVGRRPQRVLVEAPDGSTVRAEYLPRGLRQRGPGPRRRQGAGPPHRRVRSAARATCSTGPSSG